MWKHCELNPAQQTCTNARLSHQRGMREGDALYYCMDRDWDIDLESTLSLRGTAFCQAMIIEETVANDSGLWSCKT